MPQQKIFEMRAITSEERTEFVKSSVADWKKYIHSIIEQVENINSETVRVLCYFSIMESIAQDIKNYPERGMQDTFTEFVLKYQSKYSFLELLDPVTLFYRRESELSEYITMDDIVDGGVYSPEDSVIRSIAIKMKDIVKERYKDEKNEKKDKANKLLKDHRYVDLLYRLRCRVSHEFSQSGISKSEFHNVPYYMSCYREYVKDNHIVVDNVWTFHIPINFLKDLCVNCVDNYLDDCINTNSLPTENDGIDRLCELSWYNRT